MSLLRHQETCKVALKWLFGVGLLAFVLFILLNGCSKAPPPVQRPPFRGFAQVMGDSMLPTFKHGDFISVELCRFDDLAGGETVIFWDDGVRGYVHHRTVTRDSTGRWITRGDNNPTADAGRMASTDFIGRTALTFIPR